MATQWNKYEPTAARKHGKPGREIRPKSTTIDIHSHVAIPQAARVRQAASRHVDDRRSRHFATAETKALSQKQEDGHPRRASTGLRRAPRRPRRHGHRHAARHAAADRSAIYTVPLDIAVKASRMVNDGIAEYVARKPDRFVALGTVPLHGRQRSGERARTLHEHARLEGRARSSPTSPARSCPSRPSRRSGRRPRSSARWW